jgi:protein O-GlcNAc transferase
LVLAGLDKGVISAIVEDPCNSARYGRFGNALRAAGDFLAAESAYRRGLLVDPGAALLLGALGNALADQGKIDSARRVMVQAMQRAPEMELIHGALATLARRNGDLSGAVDAFRRGLVLLPMSAPLAIHHGNAASALEHHQHALTSFRWAWVLEPGLAAAANNIARAYSELRDNRRSKPWFRRAAILAPDLDAPLKSVGNAEKFIAKAGSSHKWLRRAVVLGPSNAEAISDLLFGASYVPGMDAMRLRQLHDRYCAGFGPEAPMPVRAVGTRLTVGFASPDFSAHPVGHFVAGLFEDHDPNEMRIICLSDTPRPDPMTHRLRAAADGWEETRNLDHAAWLDLARSWDFTVLIDLAGHTMGNRLPAIGRRAAAVQGNWAGYIGTTGIAAMDFVLADHVHIPVEDSVAYRERILRMPNGIITYTPPALPAGDGSRRRDSRFTFASFNNPAKINRALIDLWASILRQVPDSRLLLKYRGFDHPKLSGKLENWLAEGGVTPDRLVLEGMAPQSEMLRRYQDVDLVLDTAPYSGGATTCEALAMGVPVITWPGKTFASRHSTSHLTHAGMPALVTAGPVEYGALAVALASDPKRLETVRRALAERLPGSAHRDHAGFARDFVSVIKQAVEARG